MPVTIEGWAAVLAYVTVVIGAAFVLPVADANGRVTLPLVGYLVLIAVATTTLIYLARRYGPEPRWRWGRSPDDDPDLDY